MNRCVIASLMALMLGSSACAAPLCALAHSKYGPAPHTAAEAITTPQWMMLLLRGPAHTCLGEPIVPEQEAPRGFVAKTMPSHVLVTQDAHKGSYLVWLQTHLLGDTQFGPVAWVRQTASGWEVEALGTLQAPAADVHLNLASGLMGRTLWVRSTGCTWHKPLARNVCFEELQALPLLSRTFAASLGAPRINVLRQQATPLKHGWYRITEQRTQCAARASSLVLQETVHIEEISSRAPGLAPRSRRQAQNLRTLTFDPQGGWNSSEPDLYKRLRP